MWICCLLSTSHPYQPNVFIYVWLYISHKVKANEPDVWSTWDLGPAGSSTRLTVRQPYQLLENLHFGFTVYKVLHRINGVLMNILMCFGQMCCDWTCAALGLALLLDMRCSWTCPALGLALLLDLCCSWTCAALGLALHLYLCCTWTCATLGLISDMFEGHLPRLRGPLFGIIVTLYNWDHCTWELVHSLHDIFCHKSPLSPPKFSNFFTKLFFIYLS